MVDYVRMVELIWVAVARKSAGFATTIGSLIDGVCGVVGVVEKNIKN